MIQMFVRKPSWWWDWSWTPVGGCKPKPNSPGCTNCWVPKWLTSHTWKTETVHTGVTKVNKRGRRVWSGILTALRDGDSVWNWPLKFPGVVNPALGPGKPAGAVPEIPPARASALGAEADRGKAVVTLWPRKCCPKNKAPKGSGALGLTASNTPQRRGFN